MTKYANISISHKKIICVFAFYVITFEPIKIKTCSALQNDRLNLSFVKDINVDCEKMTRNGYKMAKIIFESVFLRIRL